MAFRKKEKTVKKVNLDFHIDCSQPVEDKVIVLNDFVEYLRQKTKVNGKLGNLGENVTISSTGSKVTVTSHIPFSKRYLKYLTKKYLKKQDLRNYLYVTSSDRKSYQLRYFNIQQDNAE
ncbi:ribosomal protein, putative [Ichthyophthirius multifiliis]|uniref:Large ribosomal subunit protein eL22 n=1 Tax=Ichthyophthirius multifiliis TaxID=5932 RepID=G0R512_ICHMU|nr:ribosomal protein, putative [Ichthyophthirius multifiliis]EGR27414.1 ribosomal protein, putative [Ichthyophthirius multifiliis]|eukprot:XP_004024324.1 ribosomal protein, putative [Ichthyophthirius multifiliis]